MFLHRLQVQGIAPFLYLRNSHLDYLNSEDIITECLKVTLDNPCMFFTCLKDVLNLELSTEFMRMVRNDKFLLLSKDHVIDINDIETVKLEMHFPVSIRERVYFVLAKQLSELSRQNDDVPKIKTQFVRESMPAQSMYD